MICISHSHRVLIALGDLSFGNRQVYDRPLHESIWPFSNLIFCRSYCIVYLPCLMHMFFSPYMIIEERHLNNQVPHAIWPFPTMILMYAPIFQLLAVAPCFNWVSPNIFRRFERMRGKFKKNANKEANLRKSTFLRKGALPYRKMDMLQHLMQISVYASCQLYTYI